MMIRISNIQLAIDQKDNLNALRRAAAQKIKCPEKDISKLTIFRRSIDARKQPIKLIYTVDIQVANAQKYSKNKSVSAAKYAHYQLPTCGTQALRQRPVIVGAGPAGLFCALILAKAGFKPLLIERGDDVTTRSAVVDRFWRDGVLDEQSNVQFGEGGAGTFSDGKLTTNTKDPRCRFVLSSLITAGAPAEIGYDNKPHVGTDVLKPVVINLRKQIIALGGEVRFRHQLTDLIIDDDQLNAIVINEQVVDCDQLFLALGHSARDSFEMLYQRGLTMTQKPFSMGVRIEHPQAMINDVQLGTNQLGAADYKLVYHGNERSSYTFCMCPGGTVVAAASEPQRLVTNGMSEQARDAVNANSALLVEVKPQDLPSGHPLAGIALQRQVENHAYQLGGGNYCAPVQSVGAFLTDSLDTAFGNVNPSYQPTVKFAKLSECLPVFVIQNLKAAIPYFGTKIKGFDRPDAILTAVESRSSSPVRIVRNAQFESNIKGIYPIGEGAGYAGGIMSAAVDGIKAAECLIERFDFKLK